MGKKINKLTGGNIKFKLGEFKFIPTGNDKADIEYLRQLVERTKIEAESYSNVLLWSIIALASLLVTLWVWG